MLDTTPFAGETIQYAIDEFIAILRAEKMRHVDRFIDRNDVRNIRTEQNLVGADKNNRPLHRVQLTQRTVN